MPRYAKGSLEDALWDDIHAHKQHDEHGNTSVHSSVAEAKDEMIVQPIKKPRANGRNSRAHRHEWFMNRTTHDKVEAIKSFCRMHDSFWLSDENLLMIVGNILDGR